MLILQQVIAWIAHQERLPILAIVFVKVAQREQKESIRHASLASQDNSAQAKRMERVYIAPKGSSSGLLGHPTAFRASLVNSQTAVAQLLVIHVTLVSTKEKRMRRLATTVPLVSIREIQVKHHVSLAFLASTTTRRSNSSASHVARTSSLTSRSKLHACAARQENLLSKQVPAACRVQQELPVRPVTNVLKARIVPDLTSKLPSVEIVQRDSIR